MALGRPARPCPGPEQGRHAQERTLGQQGAPPVRVRPASSSSVLAARLRPRSSRSPQTALMSGLRAATRSRASRMAWLAVIWPSAMAAASPVASRKKDRGVQRCPCLRCSRYRRRIAASMRISTVWRGNKLPAGRLGITPGGVAPPPQRNRRRPPPRRRPVVRILTGLPAQHQTRVGLGQGFDALQVAQHGARAHLGLADLVAGVVQRLLDAGQRLAELPNSVLTARSTCQTSDERCSMARVRKPICRLFSRAARLLGPATLTRRPCSRSSNPGAAAPRHTGFRWAGT